MLLSPRRPTTQTPLRIVIASERPLPQASIAVHRASSTQNLPAIQGGGPPYWWFAKIERPKAGRYHFALLDGKGTIVACQRGRVRYSNGQASSTDGEKSTPSDEDTNNPSTTGESPQQGESTSTEESNIEGTQVWPIKRNWNRQTENLYSVWIEKLFDAPAGTQPSWTPLHQVFHDPERNFLYNHLGEFEDGPNLQRAVVAKPDCADLPYYLRAYFAWKMRLPFGYRQCDRGTSERPSRCGDLFTILKAKRISGKDSVAERFSAFLRFNVSYVHSGAGRTAPDDDDTDLYPVSLDRKSLRPGVVYVDPYGHLLVVAKWVDQTKDHGGLLYAVDGHPDLSVGRKRFWRGAFLFSDEIKGGAGGFKAFRPLVFKNHAIVALGNQDIQDNKAYHNFSDEQYKLGLEGFYDRMDEIITPNPLSPKEAYKERLEALFELILERVGSVKVGEEYMKSINYATIAMPRGPHIFETQGAWENFSTPARDIRLLIAIDDILKYPNKVITHPKRYAFPPGETPQMAKQALEKLFQKFTEAKNFSYTRSDGSTWTLTMAELIRRRKKLEMAYNPNDCIEIRWMAEGEELSTCKRHAPEDQQQLMKNFRPWFATRQRPPLR